VVDIKEGEIGVTGGTMVVTVEEWFIIMVGGAAEQGGQIQPPTVAPGKHRPESGPREPGAGGVDPPLAAATLD